MNDNTVPSKGRNHLFGRMQRENSGSDAGNEYREYRDEVEAERDRVALLMAHAREKRTIPVQFSGILTLPTPIGNVQVLMTKLQTDSVWTIQLLDESRRLASFVDGQTELPLIGDYLGECQINIYLRGNNPEEAITHSLLIKGLNTNTPTIEGAFEIED